MDYVSLIFALIILVIDAAFLSLSIGSLSMAPWVPSSQRSIKRGLKLANPKSGEIIYDLGCGNGTVIMNAVYNYPVKAIGIEIALPLIILCKIRYWINSKRNKLKGSACFKKANLFKEDLSKADIVYLFALPKTLENKIRPKLERELKSGTKIISNVFEIKGWEPDVVDYESGCSPVYLYIKK